MKFTLLRLVTPFSLVQEYQSFGGNFSLYLQDILKKVAVLLLLIPPTCLPHS